MILTVPSRLATRLAKVAEVRAVAPPKELGTFRYIQIWHPRMDSDPAHQWLRRMFVEAAHDRGDGAAVTAASHRTAARRARKRPDASRA
jgi:DNA-binding transcriptional LysR family regulator